MLSNGEGLSPSMRQALELARRGLGIASPNPAVGAVLVRDGRIVGEGWTQPPGGPHAEVQALARAGSQARGAALYVTLEPCCYHGRTPPCSTALAQAGIAEAHIATQDPNPRVNGKGVAELRAAGVRVFLGEGEGQAQELMEGHFKWITTGLPFVIAKYAMSLDGKIATAAGESRWITGEAARQRAHHLRRTCDAILIGIGTALADDPQLTARDQQGNPLPRQALRVVVDSGARLPPQAAILRGPGKVLVAAVSPLPERVRALRAAGAEVLELPVAEARVDLTALLHVLGQREVTTLLVEGGGTLLAAFFQQSLVDKVMAFIAPVIIGGREAPTPVEGPGALALAQALRLQRVTLERLGDDILLMGYVQQRP